MPRNTRPSLNACLQSKVAAGKITDEMARKIVNQVRRLQQQHKKSMGLTAAQALARQQTADRLAAEARRKKAQAAQQAIAVKRARETIAQHPKGPFVGLRAMLDRDIHDVGGSSNVHARHQAILGQAHAGFAEQLDRLRPKKLGLVQETARLRDMVRAIYGDVVSHADSRNAANAWAAVTDRLAKRFKAAGGALHQRGDWRLPNPHHDPRKMTRAGIRAWKRDIEDMVARGEVVIKDFETGAPATATKRAELLDQFAKAIATRGLSDLTPGAFMGAGKRADRRLDPRTIEFATPDAWLWYNDKWGAGDEGIYRAMMGHLDSMSLDTALIELLGPNPAHAVQKLADEALKAASTDVGGANAAKLDHNLTLTLYRSVAGELSVPVNEMLARWGSGLRAWLTSAQLGSAMLSSTSDLAAAKLAASHLDMPMGRIVQRYTKLLAADGNKVQAIRTGLVADQWARNAAGMLRHQSDVVGHGLPEKVAETVIRGSGLAAHTQALQHAFQMELLGHLADQVSKGYDDLLPGVRAAFERVGIDRPMWQKIRTQPTLQVGGVPFLDVVGMAEAGGELMEAATRLGEVVANEVRFAVPAPGPYERMITSGGQQAGTILGEAARMMMQYKAFSISMIATHALRAARDWQGRAGQNWIRRAGYATSLLAATTMAGALALQTKEIAKGRDPVSMRNKGFWGRAFLQGGGAGIMGDLLVASTSRTGHGLATTLAGPGVALAQDVGKTVAAGGAALAEGDIRPYLGDAVNFYRKYTPGTSMWYARTLLDRMFWDQLETMADPAAAETQQRRRRRAMNRYDQDFWYGPGATLPERPPDLGRALAPLDG